MSDVVTAAAIWNEGRLRLDDEMLFVAGLRRMKLGDGEEAVVRVERKADAYTYAQLKEYWGFVIKPIHKWSGHARTELHSMFKSALLIEGQTSLTQLNREEMSTFLIESHALAREECWEAFERFEDRYGVAA